MQNDNYTNLMHNQECENYQYDTGDSYEHYQAKNSMRHESIQNKENAGKVFDY